MKNNDFFTALLQVPGCYQVPLPTESYNVFSYLVEYSWCLNCEASGLIVISVFKHKRHLYDVTLRSTNRFVQVSDICYSTCSLSYLMQFWPDELRQTVPFLLGKFKTYKLFLLSFYRALRVLEREFFVNFPGL